jgi:hypothetical protein
VNFLIYFLRKEGEDGVEKKYLIQFFEKKVKVKLNLKNGKFYTGIIIELGEYSLVFRDKFGAEIPFDYDGISYVEPIRREFNERN